MTKKGLVILSGGGKRDPEKMKAAAKDIDEIRKRFSAKFSPSDSAEIIRKFRDGDGHLL